MTKILVIRLSSLGDVVLTTPVFAALRAAYPDAHLTALVKEEFSDVLSANPDVDNCLVLRKGESLLSVVRRVRAEKFDIVIDLHGNLRSTVIRWFASAGRTVRYRKAALARRLFVRWRWTSGHLRDHTLDRYLEALRRVDPSQAAFAPADPGSILVIQTAFLGDAVLTTPLLSTLHERFPKAKLSVLCTPEVADVFRNHPGVADLFIFDKRGAERSWWKRRPLVQKLRDRRFELAVVPHRSMTSALLAWLAGIPRRIGFSSSQGRWLLTERVGFRWDVHDVERNLALLAPLGVDQKAGTLWLKSATDVQASVAARLATAGVALQDRLLGINAGSVWATKRWLPEGFAAVADRAIRELGVKVIFIGGAKDRGVVESVRALMKEPAINWAGETQLKELIAVIARCQAFLTNDSGPMHIAVASHVPTVAIFGPTTRELGFFPYEPGHVVLERDLDCRPCGLHGANTCPLGHFRCMRDISAEDVFAAVKVQLSRPPQAAVIGAGVESRVQS